MPRTGLSTEQMKDRAVDFAIARIRQQGFEKVRLSDIAKDMGVSHAALYGHFADKSALLDAVSERWLECLDASQAELCSAADQGNTLKLIEEWFVGLHRAKHEKVLADPELFRAFNLSVMAQKVFVKKHLIAMHDQLLGLVQRAIEAKEIKAQDPEMVVTLLSESTKAFHHPAMVLEHIESDQRESILRGILSLAFRGLQ